MLHEFAVAVSFRAELCQKTKESELNVILFSVLTGVVASYADVLKFSGQYTRDTSE